jgi:hypothetical protein
VTEDGGPDRPSNRRFWLVAAPAAAVAIIVVVGAVVTRPDPVPGDARADLALALRAARIVREQAGELAAADASELGVVELRLRFVAADTPSGGPRTISVQASPSRWVAAARAAEGACRWIRLTEGPGGDAVDSGASSAGPCSAANVDATA